MTRLDAMTLHAQAPAPETVAPRLPLALWLAVPILLANLAISGAAFVSTASVPLDVLLANGGEALIALALFLGVSDLLLGALFVVALLRFRARLPRLRTSRVIRLAPDRRRPAGPFLPQPL
jgi:hypothetical protein